MKQICFRFIPWSRYTYSTEKDWGCTRGSVFKLHSRQTTCANTTNANTQGCCVVSTCYLLTVKQFICLPLTIYNFWQNLASETSENVWFWQTAGYAFSFFHIQKRLAFTLQLFGSNKPLFLTLHKPWRLTKHRGIEQGLFCLHLHVNTFSRLWGLGNNGPLKTMASSQETYILLVWQVQ